MCNHMVRSSLSHLNYHPHLLTLDTRTTSPPSPSHLARLLGHLDPVISMDRYRGSTTFYPPSIHTPTSISVLAFHTPAIPSPHSTKTSATRSLPFRFSHQPLIPSTIENMYNTIFFFRLIFLICRRRYQAFSSSLSNVFASLVS